tara:strand:+ start:12074 stop:12856 length:783 start_codon:yes stop_codon:yes gene_type:complete
MAHKLYFDNVATRDATLTDGKIVNSNPGVFSFSSSGTITNENRAIDLDLTATISSFGTAIHPELGYSNNDTLQFDFSSAKTIDFMAIYFINQETDNLRIHADDAVSGNTAVQYAFTSTFSAGWNILSFTKASYRYWLLEATSGFLSPAEIFFGEAFNVTTLDISIIKPFNSFVASAYDNTEFSNKIDTELRTWTINIPLLTDNDKTQLELLQTNYSNLHTFVYYDDSEYHTVRLAKAITFNQVATNTYSATLTLQEESSS